MVELFGDPDMVRHNSAAYGNGPFAGCRPSQPLSRCRVLLGGSLSVQSHQWALLNQLSVDSLLLIDVEPIEAHSKHRATAEGRALDLLLESSGLDGAGSRRQWHVTSFRDVLLAFGGEIEMRERLDTRAGGGSGVDIDEQWS